MRDSSRTQVRPILLLEINEIPWRMLDWARRRGRWPHVERFFSRARTYTTMCRDTGELSPWITWPSLHRGMNNTEHGVRYLGQEVSTFQGTPLWDEYRNRGLSVGVFGSLQSWPPKDPGPGGFYVPDTFAHDEQCIPSYLEPLQRFNLDMVRRNGRVVRKDRFSPKTVIKLAPALLRARLQPKTALEIAQQLVSERFDNIRVSRRPIFQSILFWDVFKSLYHPENPPALSTFFTNHVAGVMHRYWDDIFPDDFPEKDKSEPRPHLDTMEFAWDFTDKLIHDALKMQEENPDLILVFATSMGQEAVHRDYEGFSAAVEHLPKLLACCGLTPEQFKPLLAMVPQVAVEIPNEELRTRVEDQLLGARTSSGEPLFRIEKTGISLSITIISPKRKDVLAGTFSLPLSDGTNKTFTWEQAGITMHEVEGGMAYHIPEGILAVVGRGIPAKDAREQIELSKVKDYLLSLGGLITPPAAETTATSTATA